MKWMVMQLAAQTAIKHRSEQERERERERRKHNHSVSISSLQVGETQREIIAHPLHI